VTCLPKMVPRNSIRLTLSAEPGERDAKEQFSEEQMVRIVREMDSAEIEKVAKRHGVSTPTLYAWKRKFGGMDVEDAKRLKALEQENAKLKKLLAERLLDIEVLKDINSKKW